MKRWVKVGLVVAGVLLLVGNTFWPRLGAEIFVSCDEPMREHIGCMFSNRGILPGHRCVTLHVINTTSQLSMDSEPICSGIVWPQTATSVMGAFPSAINSFCYISGSDEAMRAAGRGGKRWNDKCVMSGAE